MSGSPVSCRKSTSVIPQVITVCPVRTSTPGLSSAQRAMASAPRSSRPGRSARKEGPGSRGAVATRGLVASHRGRGPGGSGRLSIGWQPRPSGQQVPEETEGGAGARTDRNSLTPPPVGQVTLLRRGGGSLAKTPTPRMRVRACLWCPPPQDTGSICDARRPRGACSQGVIGRACRRVRLDDTLFFFFIPNRSLFEVIIGAVSRCLFAC